MVVKICLALAAEPAAAFLKRQQPVEPRGRMFNQAGNKKHQRHYQHRRKVNFTDARNGSQRRGASRLRAVASTQFQTGRLPR